MDIREVPSRRAWWRLSVICAPRFSLSVTSMFLADWESLRARAPPVAARWGHSKADIPSWRLVVYIRERVQAAGKGFSGRRTVSAWRVFPVGSFPHTADLVAGRRSLRTYRSRPCSGAGGSGRRLGAGTPGCRPAEGVLPGLALGCRWRRRRRPGSDVDECLALWPAHPASDSRRYSPERDGAALSRF